MYNPISLNVVRQSLDWMGLPKPTKITRAYGPFLWPSGNRTMAYRVDFHPVDVLEALDRNSLVCDQDLTPFTDLLRECFMDDIRVVEQHWDNYGQTVWYLINCTHIRNPKV